MFVRLFNPLFASKDTQFVAYFSSGWRLLLKSSISTLFQWKFLVYCVSVWPARMTPKPDWQTRAKLLRQIDSGPLPNEQKAMVPTSARWLFAHWVWSGKLLRHVDPGPLWGGRLLRKINLESLTVGVESESVWRRVILLCYTWIQFLPNFDKWTLCLETRIARRNWNWLHAWQTETVMYNRWNPNKLVECKKNSNKERKQLLTTIIKCAVIVLSKRVSFFGWDFLCRQIAYTSFRLMSSLAAWSIDVVMV